MGNKENLKNKPFGRPKPGTSKSAAEQRRIGFVENYIMNGGNATQAAIDCGYSPKTAGVQGARLLKDVRIKKEIEERQKRLAKKLELRTEDVLKELARIVYADPRKAFDSRGVLLPVNEWPDDVAAMIASIEVEELFEGSGKDRVWTGYTKKVKLWDKNSAIDKAMKHLGQYEKDNKQKHVTQEMTLQQLDAFIARKQKEIESAQQLL
jgi:phage terminase small subunit